MPKLNMRHGCLLVLTLLKGAINVHMYVVCTVGKRT